MNLRVFRLLALVAFVLVATAPFRSPGAATASAQQAVVYRDEYGVPHIYGDTAAAASYAFGYVQAEDHLSQMRQNYLAAAGRLAETGLGTSDADALVHLLHIPEVGQAAIATMPAGDRERVEAFAAGVNKYITDHPGQPAWMLPVEPYEVIAWVHSGNLLPEYQIAASELPAAAALPAAASSPYGSNMSAVAPAKSALGVPILLGDPHLQWTGTTQWYEAHLNYPGVNVAGSTFFGWPFINMGATDNVAWTMTNNSPDNADVYRETRNPANPLQYLRDGVWVDARAEIVTIKRQGQPDLPVTNYYTVHGPVIRIDAAYAYAASMVSFDLTELPSAAFHMPEAPSASALFNPADTPKIAKWNIILADTQGHIMYVYNIRLAHKSESVDWKHAVDGSLSANDWGPFLTYGELPTKVDPANGYLQNANNSPWNTAPDLVPADYPSYLYPGNFMGERARRAVEWLESKPQFTVQDMKDMSMDDLSWSGRGLAALIGPAWADLAPTYPDPDGSVAQATALLSPWDGRQSKTSTAVALGRQWVVDFFALTPTFSRESIPAYGSLGAADRTKLLDALVTAIADIRGRFGVLNPVWGDVHKISRGAAFPAGGGSAETPGLRMANATSFSGGVYWAAGGSSYQFVVAMTSPPSFYSIRPYGESEDAASPHYADQTALYTNNQFKLMPFTLSDVIAHSTGSQIYYYDPPAPAVGGIAEAPAETTAPARDATGGGRAAYALGGVVLMVVAVLAAGGWAARRRGRG